MILQSSLLNVYFKSVGSAVSIKSMLLLLAILGMGVGPRPAAAQTTAQTTTPNRPVRSEDGSVRVNNNANEIRTGPLRNASNIPLPAALPESTSEGVAIDVDPTRQAPNSIEIRPDVSYIEETFNQVVDDALGPNTRYDIQRNSLQVSTTFGLSRVAGQHGYAEGIQVTVINADGTRGEPQTVFVRGGKVTQGPNGNALPESGSIEVTYGADDVVELRVLNIRRNRAEPTESAIYFTRDFSDDGRIGEFIVEDLQNGGDLDFADGEYVQAPTGLGSAVAIATREIENRTETTEAETVTLPPFINQVTSVNEVVVAGEEQTLVEETELSRERGQVEIDSGGTPSNLSGHARGVRTQDDEQLVYSRYANAVEARLGSDGVSVAGQLRPLINNPNVPPTLLNGNVRFDPFADDNQAGLTSTLGFTQYLTRTHQVAEDIFGNPVVRAEDEDSNLLVPMGLFRNRQIVGYVPPTAQGGPLVSVNGVFELPADQGIEIAMPDPQRIGRGQSAYTDNVGGLLIEQTDGQMSFVPQWTKDGYAQSSVDLSPGEATRIIHALVPQQPGQDLQLDQRYAVTTGAGGGYAIADGGFRIISADLQPQNFLLETAGGSETAEIYAVEDTVAAGNAATGEFNGIQGIYTEVLGGEPVATVDLSVADEADARVGSLLSSVSALWAAGQPGYMKTTRAGGVYLGGSLTGGLGNQEDTVRLSRVTTTSAIDEVFERRTIETFSSARSRQEITRTESGTIDRNTGMADFQINEAGELASATFTPGPETVTITIDEQVTRELGDIDLGPRVLVETETTTDEVPSSQVVREISREQESITTRESSPNFSAVLGEVAVGGVYNFGNTPWTAAANTARAEVFYRDTVFGRDAGDSDVGIRGEVVFHPFGEVERDAYQVDAAGEVVPVYQTEPVLDANGDQVTERMTGDNGESVEVPVNRFVLDEAGDRIAQRVGTGKAKGPGAYLRVENVFGNDSGVEVAGGIQLTF
ncbi:MAG: hypothetical protein AAF716_22530 [Cyanobacteria bacterium P01_D01_bin.1]